MYILILLLTLSISPVLTQYSVGEHPAGKPIDRQAFYMIVAVGCIMTISILFVVGYLCCRENACNGSGMWIAYGNYETV